MHRRCLKWAALLIIPFLFGGCTVVRVSLNDPLKPEDVAFIIRGETTLAEVVSKLGPPDTLSASDRGLVGSYPFLDLKYSRINFGWLAKPWSPVDPDLILSRVGLGTDAFEILLDSKWVVNDHAFTRHGEGTRFTFWPF